MMAGLLAVTGCASAQPHPNRGIVVDKNFTPSHWEPVMTCRTWKKGKPKTDGNCAQWNQFHYDWHDDKWEFEVQFSDGSDKDVKVSHVVFDNYKVGDTWNG